MPEIDHWKEKLICPYCGRTGWADLSEVDGDPPKVQFLPLGFTVFEAEGIPHFKCSKCDVEVMP